MDESTSKQDACSFCRDVHTGPCGGTTPPRRPRTPPNDRPTTSAPNFLCEMCSKMFNTRKKLAQHRFSHSGHKPFVCNTCSKGFTSKFKLVRHLLIHSDAPLYACHFCGRSFHRKVLIDNEKVENGNLEDDFDFLPPKKIKDPEAKKPEDWEDNPTIDDPEDTKPEDWDKPATIPDPEAQKPTDWDTEMDGEWEPPLIDNPEYKGEWKPKQIDNPNYKGPWIHPEIDNPEYSADPELYARKELCTIGFDLWQVKSGTIFSNVLISDSAEEARLGTARYSKISILLSIRYFFRKYRSSIFSDTDI